MRPTGCLCQTIQANHSLVKFDGSPVFSDNWASVFNLVQFILVVGF